MKIKNIYTVIVFIISFVLFQSCENTTENTSRIQLKLVDGVGDYQKLLVNIIDVQYNRNDDDLGWISFEGFTIPETSDPGNRVDLCELIAGNTLVLTDEDIESGMLSHIRLILGEGNALVLNGDPTEIPLQTPSAQQSGLKLRLTTVLEPGFSYVFILDWDVQKSVVKAGNSGIYNLKPVIRIIAEFTSGTISGRVADAEETEENQLPLTGAVVTAYAESDVTLQNPIASTQSDEGLFVLPGLPEGTYILTVQQTGYDDLGPTGPYSVEKGIETEIGTLLLTQTP